MKNIKKGTRMSLALAADTPQRTAILVGDLVAVTAVAGKNGEEVECEIVDVFEGVSSAAILQGKRVKFDNTTKKWATAAAGDVSQGWAMTAAGAADATFWVKIG